MSKKKIVVLTGAGMSVESGLRTFRDADGLWEEETVGDWHLSRLIKNKLCATLFVKSWVKE